MARIAGQLQPHRQVLAGLVQPQAGAVDRFEPERLDAGRLHHDPGNAEVTPLLARAFALAPRIGLLPRSRPQRVRPRLAAVATQRKRTFPPPPAPAVPSPSTFSPREGADLPTSHSTTRNAGPK